MIDGDALSALWGHMGGLMCRGQWSAAPVLLVRRAVIPARARPLFSRAHQPPCEKKKYQRLEYQVSEVITFSDKSALSRDGRERERERELY